jgi:hypothetical protein|uniref:Uncharacterized protein n=1 Tax=Tectiviridae sp. TaxID=2831614 RepID=A0A8S5VU83_9VIRU|nr:MAG TPA: hypothetical protein [Tectiviridae sp.]
MDGLNLYMTDLYPQWNGSLVDTSNRVIPDADDMAAMEESDKEVAKKATGETRKSVLLLSVLGLIIVIVVMGIA